LRGSTRKLPMLVGHRDMIGYHKQAMPPDDSSKNISPTPSGDIQRPVGFGLNLQKQSSRKVMKSDFTQPDRKYHELSTHELEECARRRCLEGPVPTALFFLQFRCPTLNDVVIFAPQKKGRHVSILAPVLLLAGGFIEGVPMRRH